MELQLNRNRILFICLYFILNREIITDDYQGVQRYDPTLNKKENEEMNEEINNTNDSKKKGKKDKQNEMNYETEKGKFIETTGSLSSLFASSDNKPFTFFNDSEETKKEDESTSTIVEKNKRSSTDLPWYSIKKTTSSLIDNPLYFKDSEDNNKEVKNKICEGIVVPEIENTFMRTETDEEIKADWLKWRDKYTTHFKLQMKRKRNDMPTGGSNKKKTKFNK